MRVELLIIDPQVDFCDPSGNLYVTGAEHDIHRLAEMIKRKPELFDDIHITLDSHHYVDVAHPVFWRDSAGNNPKPFTIITADDVRNGRWTTAHPGLHTRMLDYVTQLEAGGRYPLCIWPPHCLIGHPGQAIMPELCGAIDIWTKRFATVDYVTKGSNIYTEHYSAVQAEVQDPTDPSTHINIGLIQTLEQADLILLAGEAGSHCLANTVRDIANNFSDPSYIKKLVLLQDATSPVTSFEQFQIDFINDLTAKGMQLASTTNPIP